MGFLFLPAETGDAQQIFSLIRERIKWMDEVGIEQWNKEDYWAFYPEEYYFRAIGEKRLYILKDEKTGAVAAAGVLSGSDGQWRQDGTKAVYLHNFVTALNARGAGDVFLRECENLARAEGCVVFRLDCAADNRKLNRYYEQHGYRAAGRMQVGEYTGIKREKQL